MKEVKPHELYSFTWPEVKQLFLECTYISVRIGFIDNIRVLSLISSRALSYDLPLHELKSPCPGQGSAKERKNAFKVCLYRRLPHSSRFRRRRITVFHSRSAWSVWTFATDGSNSKRCVSK